MKTKLVDNNLLNSDPEEFYRLIDLSSRQLKSLSTYYPNFDQWFLEKVRNGLSSGERSILLNYSEEKLSGLAILKTTEEEKKLCCLRVMPSFIGSGVGLRMFEHSFELLQTSAPLLSVAEEQLQRFERVFQHFGFERTQRYQGLYRPHRTEISFNGVLVLDKSLKTNASDVF